MNYTYPLHTIATFLVLTLAFAIVGLAHQWTGAVVLLALTGIACMVLAVVWGMALLRQKNKNKRNAIGGVSLALLGIGMFLFSYIMVPLFHLICHRFGMHGHLMSISAPPVNTEVVSQETPPLHLMVQAARYLPLQLTASHEAMHLPAGQVVTLPVDIHNPTQRAYSIRWTSSVVPNAAAHYLHPLESTPTELMVLPGQVVHYTIELYVDPNIDKIDDDVFLAYTAFEMKEPT